MNRLLLNNLIRFVLLLLLQVGICNHINLFGYLNPYVYVLYIILYPLNHKRQAFIFTSFLLGLFIDIASDSGGIHAGSAVALAYLRPYITKFSFGTLNEYYSVKFNSIDFIKRLTYITIIVVLHHFIMFLLTIFNLSEITLTLKLTLLTSLFTIFMSLLLTLIFSPRK